MNPPHSILVIATRQIGDVLLITPLLHTLHQAWPQAHVDVLVNRNKGGMLEGNPDCDRIIEVSEHPSFAEYRNLLPNLFRKYDLAINTLAGDRPHLYALWSASTRIGTITEADWKNSWKRWLNRYWVTLDNRNTHTVLQNLALAKTIGLQPFFTVTPPNNPDAEQQLKSLIPFDWQHESYAILHPSPMWRYKQWTEAGWGALIAYLLDHIEQIILTGGDEPREQALLSHLTEQCPERIHCLAGKLSFATTSRLLKSAHLYVGPDTAITHLAAACNTPTVAIYGPSNPVKWGPWPFNHKNSNPWKRAGHPFQKRGNVILLQGTQPEGIPSCIPCAEEGCDRHKQSYSACLQQLTPEQVIEAVKSIP